MLFSHHLIIIISSLRVLRGVCWSRIFLLENLPYDRFCTLLLSFWSTLRVYVFGFCNFFAFQRDLRIPKTSEDQVIKPSVVIMFDVVYPRVSLKTLNDYQMARTKQLSK